MEEFVIKNFLYYLSIKETYQPHLPQMLVNKPINHVFLKCLSKKCINHISLKYLQKKPQPEQRSSRSFFV
jgi:hypothetical protein